MNLEIYQVKLHDSPNVYIVYLFMEKVIIRTVLAIHILPIANHFNVPLKKNSNFILLNCSEEDIQFGIPLDNFFYFILISSILTNEISYHKYYY